MFSHSARIYFSFPKNRFLLRGGKVPVINLLERIYYLRKSLGFKAPLKQLQCFLPFKVNHPSRSPSYPLLD